MASIELAGGTSTLNITPWFDCGYRFNSLDMTESIGGKIGSGTVHLTSDGENINMAATETTINITFIQNSGNANSSVVYDIKGWIHMRKVIENEVYLSFITVNTNDFSVTSKVRKFKDKTLKDIIKELYPGEVLFQDDIEPDVPGPLDSIDQNGHTDYDLCDRLCRSFKKDVVYSFGLEKLSLKPRDRKDKPYQIIAESNNVSLDLFNINYYKEMDLSPENKNKSVNIQAKMYGFKYVMSRIDFHTDLYEVYMHNDKYFTDMKCTLILKYHHKIPDFKIGDIVIYENKFNFNKDKKYIVSSIEFKIDNNKIDLICSCNSWEDVNMGGKG